MFNPHNPDLASPSRCADVALALRRLMANKSTDDQSEFCAAWLATLQRDIRQDPRLAADIAADFARLRVKSPEYQMTLEALRVWSMCRWLDKGLPVLKPTESLAASLVLTQFKGLLVQDVPLPFDPVLIEVPRPWLPPPFDEIGVIWLYRFDAVDRKTETEHPFLRVEAVTTSGMAFDKSARLDGEVERWIESTDKRPESEDTTDDEMGVIRLCVRLAVGVAVYMASLTSAGRAAAHRPKAHKKGQPPKPTAIDQWVLGQDIVLPRELRLLATDFVQARRKGAGHGGWRLTKRFAVRGHFRRVVVGPRVEQHREFHWVRPYMKGPEQGVGLRRAYVL